jgi:hypothetical protein
MKNNLNKISEALKVKSTELTEWSQELTFAQIWSDVAELKGLEFNSVKEGKEFVKNYFETNPTVKTNETKVVSSAVKKDGKVYLPASTFSSPTVCYDMGELKYYNF